MGDKVPFMPLYGFDYYSDEKVQLMTDKQDAWYHRLLWHQWVHGSVPIEEVPARKIARPEFGTRAKEWSCFYVMYCELFTPIDGYRGQNARLEQVRAKHIKDAEARREKARNAGIASGQARRESNSTLNASSTQVNPKPNPNEPYQNQNQNQRTKQPTNRADAPAEDSPNATVSGLIREHLYVDGQPPTTKVSGREWSLRRDLNIVKALRNLNIVETEIWAAVQGVALLRDRGELGRIKPNDKLTMRVLYNKKDGQTNLWRRSVSAWQQAENSGDAKAKTEAIPHRPRPDTDKDPQHIGVDLKRFTAA